MSKVLSAVAWPYANGPRHIGHVAGFGVPSDVFSRFMRMAGHDVLMVSGTDEHGTPILVTADKEGISAKDLADKNNAVIVTDLADLGLSYDLFDTEVAGRYRDRVLARGGADDAAQLVADFLGRPYTFDAYAAWLAR